MSSTRPVSDIAEFPSVLTQWRRSIRAVRRIAQDSIALWVRQGVTPAGREIICSGRLKSCPAFAAKLERALRQAVDTLPSQSDLLYKNIESIDLIPASAIARKSRDLDERGTSIWNLASKHKEDAGLADALALGQPTFERQSRNLPLPLTWTARAFASLLLDRTQQLHSSAVASQLPQEPKSEGNIRLIATTDDTRVLKVTLKASRRCLGPYFVANPGSVFSQLIATDRHQLGVAEQIIERAAFYEKRLRQLSQDGNAQNLASTSRRLSHEYHILRIALVSWPRGPCQGRSMAEALRHGTENAWIMLTSGWLNWTMRKMCWKRL